MSPITPQDYFDQGLAAGQKNFPITACNLLYKAWPYDAWCLGWQLSQIERQASQKPWPGWTTEPLAVNVKTPFEQGQVAKLKGTALDDNPYDPPSRDWTHWRNGWIEDLGEPTCSYAWPLWWKPIGVAVVIAGIMWALAWLFILR